MEQKTNWVLKEQNNLTMSPLIIHIGRKNKGGKFMNIAIIGSGSWGVALAVHLASIGNNVKIWSFMEEERDLLNNERKCKFLPETLKR